MFKIKLYLRWRISMAMPIIPFPRAATLFNSRFRGRVIYTCIDDMALELCRGKFKRSLVQRKKFFHVDVEFEIQFEFAILIIFPYLGRKGQVCVLEVRYFV